MILPDVVVVPSHLAYAAWAPGKNASVHFDFGSPPVGLVWMVRTITTYDTDDHRQTTRQCSVWTGDIFNLSCATLHITGLEVPATIFVPDAAIVCHPGDNLIVTTNTIAVGRSIGVNVTLEEWLAEEIIREEAS